MAELRAGGPRVRYQVAASLDGFIAPRPGALGPGKADHDWIPHDPDIDFGALFAQFDTLLMGRKTYEGMLAQGSGTFGMTTCVVSRTMRADDHPGVQVVHDDLPGAVADLKARSTKDIWLFGGGELLAGLVSLGLVDRIEIAVVPALLGDGVLIIAPSSLIPLRYTGQRVYPKSGIVLLEYDVR